jgi:hypothetical protein
MMGGIRVGVDVAALDARSGFRLSSLGRNIEGV